MSITDTTTALVIPVHLEYEPTVPRLERQRLQGALAGLRNVLNHDDKYLSHSQRRTIEHARDVMEWVLLHSRTVD